MGCIFCAIIEGRAPAEVVFEDEETMAFMDLHPANPGHTLVVPKKHVPNIYTLDDETGAAVLRTTVRVAKAVKAALQPEGVSLLQTNEPAGGQSVFHFHIHVIPRWLGDGLHPTRPPTKRSSRPLHEIATQIKEHLR